MIFAVWARSNAATQCREFDGMEESIPFNPIDHLKCGVIAGLKVKGSFSQLTCLHQGQILAHLVISNVSILCNRCPNRETFWHLSIDPNDIDIDLNDSVKSQPGGKRPALISVRIDDRKGGPREFFPSINAMRVVPSRCEAQKLIDRKLTLRPWLEDDY